MRQSYYPVMIVVAIVMISGCGYKFTGSSKGLLADVRTLAIEFPTNRTVRPQLEGPVNEALKRRFLEDGSISPAASASADAVLRSAVISYREDPFTYRSGSVILQYKIEMEIEVELLADEEVLIRQRFVRHRLCEASPERLLDFDVNRQAAVERIAADLAWDVYVQLQEAF